MTILSHKISKKKKFEFIIVVVKAKETRTSNKCKFASVRSLAFVCNVNYEQCACCIATTSSVVNALHSFHIYLFTFLMASRSYLHCVWSF